MHTGRIILFSNYYVPNVGGVATHVHELARTMGLLGYDVVVVTRRASKVLQPRSWLCRRTIDKDSVPALELSEGCLPGGHGRRTRWRRAFRRVVEGGSVSGQPSFVLHSHTFGTWWIKTELPHVFTNHCSYFLQDVESGKTERWHTLFRRLDWIIAPSRELADKTAFVGFPDRQVSYIPNGVDVERFKPDANLRAEVRRELSIDRSEVVVLCARRFTPKNGVIDFAHSLRFLKSESERVTILFAGNSMEMSDTYEKETLGAILRSGLGHRTRLLGSVPNSEMHRLYAAADLSVLPSLKEATSISGLESMATGVPMVGTNVGGIPDLIEHGRDGLLVSPGDPRELGSAISRLICNPSMRVEFGDKARQKAVARFAWKEIVRQTLEVYEQAKEHAIRRLE